MGQGIWRAGSWAQSTGRPVLDKQGTSPLRPFTCISNMIYNLELYSYHRREGETMINTSVSRQSILIVDDSADDYESTLRAFKKVNLYNLVH